MVIKKEIKQNVVYVTIVLEENEIISIDENNLVNSEQEATIFIDIKKGSSCSYYIVASKKIIRRARVHEHAAVTWYETVIVNEHGESIIETELVALGAVGNIFSAVYATKTSQYNIFHAIYHKAPETISNIITRGIVQDTAKIIYRSLIGMAAYVDGAIGKQKADMLIASPKASVEAIPDLAIRHHAVQCSHGVSITTLQELPLFYLASRGFSDDEAKKTLLASHIVPMFDYIADQQKRAELANRFEQAITTYYGC